MYDSFSVVLDHKICGVEMHIEQGVRFMASAPGGLVKHKVTVGHSPGLLRITQSTAVHMVYVTHIARTGINTYLLSGDLPKGVPGIEHLRDTVVGLAYSAFETAVKGMPEKTFTELCSIDGPLHEQRHWAFSLRGASCA